MDGFVIKQTRFARIAISPQDRRLVAGSSCNLSRDLSLANCRYALRAFCAARAQKSGQRLIDNPNKAKTLSSVRKYVHCEWVVTQPMASG
jgi:hypothetical protein